MPKITQLHKNGINIYMHFNYFTVFKWICGAYYWIDPLLCYFFFQDMLRQTQDYAYAAILLGFTS
jgi:hypothetical protein